MSILHLNAAWSARVADPQAKLVLVRLADRADRSTGRCWPSISDLVEDTELGRSTVCRKLESLEKLGLITKDRKKNGCEYTLNLTPPREEEAPPAPAKPQEQKSKKEPEKPKASAPTSFPIEEAWSDRMPTEAARDFTKLEAWINSLHPKWKERPHFTRAEREELLANSKIFFDLSDKDKALLAAYLDAVIPEEWEIKPKPWQPDHRGQLVRSVIDVLGHADRWERECRKRKVPTGIKAVGGAA